MNKHNKSTFIILSYRNNFIIESLALLAYIENMGLQFIDLDGDDKTSIIKTRWDLIQSLTRLNSIRTNNAQQRYY